MSKMKKALCAAALVGAVALPMSSANAWWGGGPWDGWGNGWGNGDMSFSMSGRGNAYGNGYGYPGYYGYGPGYWGPGYGYGPYYGGPGYGYPPPPPAYGGYGYPGYGYGAPPAPPQQQNQGGNK